MRVALSICDGRLSPVFDVAQRLLLVDLEDGQEVSRTETAIAQTDLVRRARHIDRLGVNVLICGAISRQLEAQLSAADVRVVGQICGLVEEVLQAYFSGELARGAYRMPGCCGRRRQYRGGPERCGQKPFKTSEEIAHESGDFSGRHKLGQRG